MSKYNVLFTETGTQGGGSFQSLHQLVQALDPELFRPVVVFVNRTRFYDLFRDMGVTTHLLTDLVYTKTIPWWFQKRLEHACEGVYRRMPWLAPAVIRTCHGPFMRRLKAIMRDEKIDLLYMNDQIDRDIFGCFLHQDTGVPVVSHLRSRNGEPFAPAKARFANEHVGAYIPNALVVRDYWQGLGVDPARSFLIYNGMPEFEVTPLDLQAEFSIPEEAYKVVCVSRLIPEKGHEFLLDGFAELARRREDAVLVIVGDGRHRQVLEERTQALGLAGRVVFTGMDLRAKEIMAAGHAVVQPSEFDSFGRTVPEAMMVGTPVVATDVGSIREIIRHGENGLLAPYGDAAALADQLERLFDHPAEAQAMAREAGRTVRSEFSLAAKARQTENIMRSLIEGRTPSMEAYED